MVTTMNARQWWVTGAVACVIAGGGVITANLASADGWEPTASEVGAAVKVAHVAAEGAIPGPDGAPLIGNEAAVTDDSAWPGNVSGVAYVGLDKGIAGPYVGRDYKGDKGNLILVELTGDFSVNVTGPRGAPSFVRGTLMIVAVDPTTGEATDFTLTKSGDTAFPKNSVSVYRVS